MPATKRGGTQRARLVATLDQIFSRYIRLRVCDEYGYSECFTCGVRRHWKEVDAGHFITRAKFATRWDPVNVQFQCKRCNMNGGKQFEFGLKIDGIYGDGTAQEILIKSQRPARYSVADLEQMIRLYKSEVGKLEGIVG
jgi:hypothetical protein